MTNRLDSDFEVNESGTLRQLNLEDMALRAALGLIDALRSQAELDDLLERSDLLEALRAELGDDYKAGAL